jgi:hypothetical protein
MILERFAQMLHETLLDHEQPAHSARFVTHESSSAGICVLVTGAVDALGPVGALASQALRQRRRGAGLKAEYGYDAYELGISCQGTPSGGPRP